MQCDLGGDTATRQHYQCNHYYGNVKIYEHIYAVVDDDEQQHDFDDSTINNEYDDFNYVECHYAYDNFTVLNNNFTVLNNDYDKLPYKYSSLDPASNIIPNALTAFNVITKYNNDINLFICYDDAPASVDHITNKSIIIIP